MQLQQLLRLNMYEYSKASMGAYQGRWDMHTTKVQIIMNVQRLSDGKQSSSWCVLKPQQAIS